MFFDIFRRSKHERRTRQERVEKQFGHFSRKVRQKRDVDGPAQYIGMIEVGEEFELYRRIDVIAVVRKMFEDRLSSNVARRTEAYHHAQRRPFRA